MEKQRAGDTIGPELRDLRHELWAEQDARRLERSRWISAVIVLACVAIAAVVITWEMTRDNYRHAAIKAKVAHWAAAEDGSVRFEWIKPKGD